MMDRDRREFFTGTGSGYQFADVLAHSEMDGKVVRFLARMDDGTITVMRPAYGHFKPCDEDPRNYKWL